MHDRRDALAPCVRAAWSKTIAIERGAMRKLANKRRAQQGFLAASVALGVALTMPQAALADEGGVSFWIPWPQSTTTPR
jgi:hypothetical protein